MELGYSTEPSSWTAESYKTDIKELHKKISAELKAYKNVTAKMRVANNNLNLAKEAFDKKENKKNRGKLIRKTSEFDEEFENFYAAYDSLTELIDEMKQQYKGLIDIVSYENKNKGIKEQVNFEDYTAKVMRIMRKYDYDLLELAKSKKEEIEVPKTAFVPTTPETEEIKPTFSTLNVAPITLDVTAIVKKAVDASIEKLSHEMDKKIEDYINNLNLDGIETLINKLVEKSNTLTAVTDETESTEESTETEVPTVTTEEVVTAEEPTVSTDEVVAAEEPTVTTEKTDTLDELQETIDIDSLTTGEVTETEEPSEVAEIAEETVETAEESTEPIEEITETVEEVAESTEQAEETAETTEEVTDTAATVETEELISSEDEIELIEETEKIPETSTEPETITEQPLEDKEATAEITVEPETTDIKEQIVNLEEDIFERENKILERLKTLVDSVINISMQVEDVTINTTDLTEGYTKISELQKSLNEEQSKISREQQGIAVKQRLLNDSIIKLQDGQNTLYERQKTAEEFYKNIDKEETEQ